MVKIACIIFGKRPIDGEDRLHHFVILSTLVLGIIHGLVIGVVLGVVFCVLLCLQTPLRPIVISDARDLTTCGSDYKGL